MIRNSMNHKRAILLLLTAIQILGGCEAISKFIHDDEVVARQGKNRLYISELNAVLPQDISQEDSVRLSLQYIHSWALENLLQNIAQEQLSKEEMDVDRELEDYRKSLLKFRYEQRYINDRLDTLITRQEVESYYESHKESFVLELPIVKARFLDIMKESPERDRLKKLMASNDYEDLALLDTLAYSAALRYEEHSEEWMSILKLARLFGTDYLTVLSKLGPDKYIEIEEEDKGDVKIGYVCSILRQGSIPLVEYCEQKIKDIIISNRKHELLSTLERDLLDDAIANDKLVIYGDENRQNRR